MSPAVEAQSLKYYTIREFPLHFKDFFYLFIFVLGLGCCTGPFSSCREQGRLSSCHSGASHCGGFSSYGAQSLGSPASVPAAPQLRSCDLWTPEQGLNRFGPQS